MKSSFNALMQSKFYSSSFNTAIFDGPIRIYFAQAHESIALKIYLQIQQQLIEEVQLAKDKAKLSQANVLIMMYPSQESFLLSFEGHHNHNWELELWNEDCIIGLRGPLAEEETQLFIENLRHALREWSPKPLVRAVPSHEVTDHELTEL